MVPPQLRPAGPPAAASPVHALAPVPGARWRMRGGLPASSLALAPSKLFDRSDRAYYPSHGRSSSHPRPTARPTPDYPRPRVSLHPNLPGGRYGRSRIPHRHGVSGLHDLGLLPALASAARGPLPAGSRNALRRREAAAPAGLPHPRFKAASRPAGRVSSRKRSRSVPAMPSRLPGRLGGAAAQYVFALSPVIFGPLQPFNLEQGGVRPGPTVKGLAGSTHPQAGGGGVSNLF
jgi:hypothetical protein